MKASKVFFSSNPTSKRMKMNKKNPHPRLFNEVLEAIAYLKEKKGSTRKTIMNQVDSILSMKRNQFKNDVNQFYRALQHGLDTGLITEKSGKYKLGLRPKDYRVFRDFQRILVGDDHFREHRRRGRKGRRRRRRRGRRRNSSIGLSGTDGYNTDGSYSSTSSPRVAAIPEDRSRRRGRKRRRRRRSGRRSRRGRRVTGEEITKSRVPPEVVPENPEKSSNDSIKSAKNRKLAPDKRKESDRKERDDRDKKVDRNDEDRNQFESRRENRDESVDFDNQQCEHPECLCNMKNSQDGSLAQQ